MKDHRLRPALFCKSIGCRAKPNELVNKIDRPNARPKEMQDLVLELFLELEASDEQFNALFF